MSTKPDQPRPAVKPGVAAPDVALSAAEELGTGNLDKVRDILFGGQMRDNDRRFARIEDRLIQETVELKDEVRKRLGVLEQFVKQETDSLADRIRREQEERTDADKDAAREFRDAAKALEKKTDRSRTTSDARSANCVSRFWICTRA